MSQGRPWGDGNGARLRLRPSARGETVRAWPSLGFGELLTWWLDFRDVWPHEGGTEDG